MKKTFFLLLLAGLAIVGCVATREVSIPLTESNGIEEDEAEFLKLPVLPVDVSQIEYLDVEAPEFKDGDFVNVPTFFDAVAKSWDMVQLDRIPTKRPYKFIYVTDLHIDGNRLFVTLALSFDDDCYPLQSRVHAIYTTGGKLVSLLGENIGANVGRKKGGSTSGTGTEFRIPKNDTEYYTATLSVDYQRKEVCLLDRNKLVRYDYDGNYQRTEVLGFNSNKGPHTVLHLNDGSKAAYTSFEQNRPSEGFYLLDNENRPKVKAPVFRNERIGGKDNMNISLRSDTIWELLPNMVVARYVYRGIEGLSDKSTSLPYWEKVNTVSIVDERYVYTEFCYTYQRIAERQYKSRVLHMLYDRSTKRHVLWQKDRKNEPYTMKNVIQDCTLLCFTPDNQAVYSFYADDKWNLKKMLAYSLDKGSNNEKHYELSKREEELIRSLKLDGGPVLFFVKLKKF